MYSLNVHLLLSVFVLVNLCDGCAGRQNWECKPLSIGGETTNPSAMDLDMRIERVGRGEFFFSGTFFWNIDLDDSVLVEMQILRSHSGSEADYKLTPWSIPQQTFIEYIDTFYKDLLMANLGDCTDLPRYDSGYVPPWPKGTFNFTRCGIKGDGLPEVLVEGFYKVQAIITALPTVQQNITAIIQVTLKMF
nr:uncharacterized protein LOC108076657 isoform X2 [Drosophila kikkawai]